MIPLQPSVRTHPTSRGPQGELLLKAPGHERQPPLLIFLPSSRWESSPTFRRTERSSNGQSHSALSARQLEQAHQTVGETDTKSEPQIRERGQYVVGPTGVGKSHLLSGLGIRAIQLGFSVQYFRFDELLTALRADAHLPPARLKSRKYMSSALLLVDEMGYDPMNREDASLFFRLVSYRYGRGAMIITTNKSIRDWTDLLAGDEVLATAILDRLLHRSHVLNIKGRSYRLRDLEDALKG